MAPRSLENASEDPDALVQANRELSNLIFTGHSFSGNERHCAFLNVGDGGPGPRFARISATTGLDLPDDGRGVALSDWDQDGDVDMWISNRNAPRIRFFRNDAPQTNHFVAIRLTGNGRTTSRDAIGARIEVHPDPPHQRPLVKTLRGGEGFLSQSSKWVHFGLGEVTGIRRVVVRWPGGGVEEFSGPEVNSRCHLVQGSGKVRSLPAPTRTLALAPGAPPKVPSQEVARIPLAYRLPMIRVPYHKPDGSTDWARFNEGRPVLLNLWASWCAPCIAELQDFAAREADIRAAGLDVLAISVDGFGDDSSPAAARELTARLEFPFETGHATEQLLSGMEIMHHRQIPMRRQLPLPTSFLVDARGRLAAIYRGPVSVDVLLADVEKLGGTARERFLQTAAFPGRTIDHPKIDLARRRTETLIRFRLATGFEQSGRFEEAAMHYRGVIDLSPEYAEAHNNLGNVLDRLRRFGEAEEHLQRAIDLKPDFAFAHHNLGNVLLHQNSVFTALRFYRKAIELDPGEAGFHFSLANALLTTNQSTEEARAALEKAIELNPRMDAAHLLLGVCCERMENPQEAVTHYARALQINPENVQARERLERIREDGN